MPLPLPPAPPASVPAPASAPAAPLTQAYIAPPPPPGIVPQAPPAAAPVAPQAAAAPAAPPPAPAAPVSEQATAPWEPAAPAPSHQPAQDLAVRQETSMAAHAPDQLRTLSVAQQAEEEGWEGLNFTAFGVFPSVKLDQGFFKTSDGENLGEQFKCVCGVGKRRWLYKTAVPDNNPAYEIAYSTDNATQSMTGSPLADIVAKWRAAGMGYESQIYYDIPATLEDGRMMLLQVPPASQGNMTNMVATRIMRRLPAHETWVLIGKGQTVTGGKSKKDFTPVTFTILK